MPKLFKKKRANDINETEKTEISDFHASRFFRDTSHITRVSSPFSSLPVLRHRPPHFPPFREAFEPFLDKFFDLSLFFSGGGTLACM